jgi:hypothetical protein
MVRTGDGQSLKRSSPLQYIAVFPWIAGDVVCARHWHHNCNAVDVGHAVRRHSSGCRRRWLYDNVMRSRASDWFPLRVQA